MYTKKFGIRLLVVFTVAAVGLASLVPITAKPVNVPVVYYKLPNGLKVVISEDHVAPVVTVAVYYNVGFRLEPKGSHRVCSSFRTHDVSGLGQREEV